MSGRPARSHRAFVAPVRPSQSLRTSAVAEERPTDLFQPQVGLAGVAGPAGGDEVVLVKPTCRHGRLGPRGRGSWRRAGRRGGPVRPSSSAGTGTRRDISPRGTGARTGQSSSHGSNDTSSCLGRWTATLTAVGVGWRRSISTRRCPMPARASAGPPGVVAGQRGRDERAKGARELLSGG